MADRSKIVDALMAQQQHFQPAANMAAYLSSLIESPDIGPPMNAGGTSYHPAGPETYFGDKAVKGLYPSPHYDFGNIGSTMRTPYFGGIKLAVPAGAGFGNYGSEPFQQEVYGYLTQLGHPVLGPSFEDVYGKPGLIGFGKR